MAFSIEAALRLGATARSIFGGTAGTKSGELVTPHPIPPAQGGREPTSSPGALAAVGAVETRRPNVGELAAFPPAERWDHWVEYEATAWPRKAERRYTLVPTTCFNCEAACGLLAYVDKDTLEIRKFEGNPVHPGSRGRTCAKGPATLNQVYDPERILYPLKRAGPRGSGQWERTTWDEVLNTFAARIRRAFVQGRHNEVMYHVGRPGEDGYMERVLWSWGIDGHNSHTNVCSSSGRLGYAVWDGGGPALARPRERSVHPLDLRPPGIGPLLQSPRPADHGRQEAGGEAGGHGPAPLEYGLHGRLLDGDLSGQ